MSEPAPSILKPDGEPARGVGNLAKFLKRYGAMVALLSTPLQFAGGYYLHTTFQTKAEAKVEREKQDEKIEANRQLVYDRTRPIMERVGLLEGKLQVIDNKLDERAKTADERAKRQDADAEDMKRSLHAIQDLLMRAPSH